MQSGALIVSVSEAAPTVDPHRSRLDPSRGLGVPAHVTVLFPFMPPESMDSAAIERLATAVRSVPAFQVRFSAHPAD
jgi:2'-5' RNA ligase